MAERIDVTYFGETYSVSPRMLKNIEEGKMTTYAGQCHDCLCSQVPVEDEKTDIYLHAWGIEKCSHCPLIYKHTLIRGLLNEIEELRQEKEGIEKEKRNRGKNFIAFERKWFILYEVIYKRAKPGAMGKIAKATRAKMYKTGYALIYAAVKMDRATFNLTAAEAGISKETAAQVYAYIQQNPPPADVMERAEKKGLNNLCVDW